MNPWESPPPDLFSHGAKAVMAYLHAVDRSFETKKLDLRDVPQLTHIPVEVSYFSLTCCLSFMFWPAGLVFFVLFFSVVVSYLFFCLSFKT